jgi:hypothetical protein
MQNLISKSIIGKNTKNRKARKRKKAAKRKTKGF